MHLMPPRASYNPFQNSQSGRSEEVERDDDDSEYYPNAGSGGGGENVQSTTPQTQTKRSEVEEEVKGDMFSVQRKESFGGHPSSINDLINVFEKEEKGEEAEANHED